VATYAIGDVQGCFDELKALLRKVEFKKADRLWFVGDLVNRGPKSLEVLRFVRDLGERAVTVLGNHDLHLIAQYEGIEKIRRADTFQDVLDARDADELVAWLRAQPMVHAEGGYAMVHAGLLPQWSIARAQSLGREVSAALAAEGYREFLNHMYGNQPERWDDALEGWDRLRVIVNAMTRMRYCDGKGRIDLSRAGTEPAKGYRRWYETRRREPGKTLVFGHWSQLGLVLAPGIVGLDSGCIWGGRLSALRLDDRTLFQLPCPGYQEPEGGG
jgi:bis(5'-nucleosyl)-tetraphosphatase (symmetrical)